MTSHHESVASSHSSARFAPFLIMTSWCTRQGLPGRPPQILTALFGSSATGRCCCRHHVSQLELLACSGASGATRVIFGAAAPLGLLAPALRRAGARQILGLTHGHETWWAALPGARQLLRRIGDSCDHLTAISAYTERRIGGALSPAAAAPAVAAGTAR